MIFVNATFPLEDHFGVQNLWKSCGLGWETVLHN